MQIMRKLSEKLESSCQIGGEELPEHDNMKIPVSLVVKPIYLEADMSPVKKGAKGKEG